MHKKKGKSGFLMFKIDFEKAYDRVDWNFLRLTLAEFGFPQQTINLIMSYTTTSSLSLKWNNEMLESFLPTRGLRQRGSYVPVSFCSVYGKTSTSYSGEGCCQSMVAY